MDSKKTTHVSSTELLCPTPPSKPGTLHVSLSQDNSAFVGATCLRVTFHNTSGQCVTVDGFRRRR